LNDGIAADQAVGGKSINAAVQKVKRIEELLSVFEESSQINLINRNADLMEI
jgi:thiamine biosynthesis lipoprotein ApbE